MAQASAPAYRALGRLLQSILQGRRGQGLWSWSRMPWGPGVTGISPLSWIPAGLGAMGHRAESSELARLLARSL